MTYTSSIKGRDKYLALVLEAVCLEYKHHVSRSITELPPTVFHRVFDINKELREVLAEVGGFRFGFSIIPPSPSDPNPGLIPIDDVLTADDVRAIEEARANKEKLDDTLKAVAKEHKVLDGPRKGQLVKPMEINKSSIWIFAQHFLQLYPRERYTIEEVKEEAGKYFRPQYEHVLTTEDVRTLLEKDTGRSISDPYLNKIRTDPKHGKQFPEPINPGGSPLVWKGKDKSAMIRATKAYFKDHTKKSSIRKPVEKKKSKKR
jgi:hypothetical protein